MRRSENMNLNPRRDNSRSFWHLKLPTAKAKDELLFARAKQAILQFLAIRPNACDKGAGGNDRNRCLIFYFISYLAWASKEQPPEEVRPKYPIGIEDRAIDRQRQDHLL